MTDAHLTKPVDDLELWIGAVFDPIRVNHESQRLGRPVVTLSYAQSLDGSIAGQPGAPLRLSGNSSLLLTHHLRALHGGILVGIGTILADNPHLTTRLVEGASPQPVISDSYFRLPPAANVMDHPKHAWIAGVEAPDPGRKAALEAAGACLLTCPPDTAGQVHLPSFLQILYQRGIRSLMVEGGTAVISAFIRQRLVDQLVLTVAPLFIGGVRAMEAEWKTNPNPPFPKLGAYGIARLGEDVIVFGDFSTALL